MIGFLDCTSGISGDKCLAALVSAGASAEAVRAAVASVDPSVRVEFSPVVRGGVAALGVNIVAEEDPVHRTWADIRTLLESADLAPAVADRATEVFTLLAQAEATVHDTTPDEVHFHEIGAIDSIADVVGACAALHDLSLTELVCGTISLGSGTVETAHGTLPVPAPATALLVESLPVESGQAPGEATTPTGAALVRAFATSFGMLPPMVPSAVGHGAGTRETPGMPNVARLIVGERITTANREPARDRSPGSLGVLEPVIELVTAIDHLSAEHLADTVDRLFAAGALDVWQTPTAMKKGRLGTEVTVLCEATDEPRLASLLIDLTGTLGVRVRHLTRYAAPRELRTIETSLGPVRFKIGGTEGSRRIRAEYDDVAEIARRQGLPADRVARLLEAEAESHLPEDDDPPTSHGTR